MAESSHKILERLRTNYGRDIDLTLRPAYRDLLVKLGHPHHHLPPVFHIAGTNGKGSTCAFLRAILEAAGHKVHVYTSPHLVTFHERIRIAGKLISENELTDILQTCENLAEIGTVSYFEASTAAALVAFARHKADFTILETGLGGRLDATNIVDKPVATIITRLSYDHRDYLGDTIEQIAGEKAGIMRSGVPCFVAPQPDAAALATLRAAAAKIGAPLVVGGIDWKVEEQENEFIFEKYVGPHQGPHPLTPAREGRGSPLACSVPPLQSLALPPPALLGQHQYWNAGLAIAALGALPAPVSQEAIARGLRTVEWPARLQRLTAGALVDALPRATELWLDGGHNDSAGEVLATQIERWRLEDGDALRPLCVVLGMLTTKNPAEFLTPFARYITRLCTVAIEDEALSFSAENLAAELNKMGLAAEPAMGIEAALQTLATRSTPAPRILICGSLYLAGRVLTLSG